MKRPTDAELTSRQDDQHDQRGEAPRHAEAAAAAAFERFRIREVLEAIEIAIDRRDIDGFAGHFTADASYDGPFGRHGGRAAIAEMSRAHHAAGSMLGKRRMTGPAVVELAHAGRRARAYSHWWVAEAAAEPGVYSTGSYRDDLRLEEDGVWRIERRVQTIDPSWRGSPPPEPDDPTA
jgi:hypothetical protein